MTFNELPVELKNVLDNATIARIATRTNRKGLNITIVMHDDSRLRWLQSVADGPFELVLADVAALKMCVKPAAAVQVESPVVEMTVAELAAIDPREPFEAGLEGLNPAE